MKNRLIVTGQMRSGTTMLSSFLNSQKGITVFPDVLRVATAALNTFGTTSKPDQELTENQQKQLFNNFAKLVKLKRERPVNHIGQELESDLIHRLTAKNTRPTFTSEADLYRVLLEMLAIDGGIELGTILGTKATQSEVLAHTLAESGMKAIIILRDPRAVYLSQVMRVQKDRSFRVNTDLFNFIEGWRHAFKVWAEPGRAMALRYEDFLVNDDTLDRLGDYLGYSLDRNVKIVSANSSFGDKSTGRRRVEALDRWREYGDPKTMAQIAEKLQLEMARAGYL